MHFTQPTHSTPAARSSSALIRITTDSPRFAGSGRTDCSLGRWGTNANWSEDRSHTDQRCEPASDVQQARGVREHCHAHDVWPMELDSPDAGRLSDDFGSVSPPIQA